MKILSTLLAAILYVMPVAAGNTPSALDALRSLNGEFAFTGISLPQAVLDVGSESRTSGLSDTTRGAARKRLTMDKGLIYVLDGDTIYYGEKGTEKLKIRIAGIDTPEIKHYAAGKFEDQEYGQEATKFGRAIIKKAKKVEYMPLGLDKYGRTLAHIFVDGELYGVKMLEKGLAYETISRYGDNDCKKLAAEIKAAAEAADRMSFEDPHDWRAREWSEEKEAKELKKDLAAKRVKMDKSLIKFDDGDTIFYKDFTFRILGMDTPEITHEKDGIFEDQEYGREAAKFTKDLILKSDKIEYITAGKDLYDRTLAHIFVDGELLAIELIKAGLAYEDVSKFGPTGFPGYARMVLAAARTMPTPPFENPLYWRAKHQKKDGK